MFKFNLIFILGISHCLFLQCEAILNATSNVVPKVVTSILQKVSYDMSVPPNGTNSLSNWNSFKHNVDMIKYNLDVDVIDNIDD